MQLDQNIAMTCALHSLLPLTHTTKEMKIVLGEDENKFGHELDSNIPDNSDEIEHTNVIKLQNGLGKMRKRKRKAVIQWHNFNIEKEPEKHYRSHIMLFLLWRTEEKL